jgi:hypothetical protein
LRIVLKKVLVKRSKQRVLDLAPCHWRETSASPDVQLALAANVVRRASLNARRLAYFFHLAAATLPSAQVAAVVGRVREDSSAGRTAAAVLSLRDARRLPEAVPYRDPPGAVIGVKLKPSVLRRL